jgi:hypothetical protein
MNSPAESIYNEADSNQGLSPLQGTFRHLSQGIRFPGVAEKIDRLYQARELGEVTDDLPLAMTYLLRVPFKIMAMIEVEMIFTAEAQSGQEKNRIR